MFASSIMWTSKLTLLLLLILIISTPLLLKEFSFSFSTHHFISIWKPTSQSASLYLFLTINFLVLLLWALSHTPQPASQVQPKPTFENYPKPTSQDQPKPTLERQDSERWCCGTVNSYVPDKQVDAPITSHQVVCQAEAEDESLQDESPSMDATWAAIMAARGRKQMTKSDTVRLVSAKKSPPVVMKKWETFNESKRRPVLRKEVVVVGNDELNRKFEFFINKVKDQWRIQRQESYQRLIDMVKYGTNYG